MSTERRAEPDAIGDFARAFTHCLDDGRFVGAVLSKHRGEPADLQRVDIRRVVVRRQPMLQFVYHHTTRDIAHNHKPDDAVALARSLLGPQGFRQAHLRATDGTHELSVTQRGQARLQHLRQPAPEDRDAAAARATPAPSGVASAPVVDDSDGHNREKKHMLTLDRPFLQALGVTTQTSPRDATSGSTSPGDERRPGVVPAMARKWKQINKFVEVFAAALASSSLADAPQLSVFDFGSGKGYLTFAVHDWLTHTAKMRADVVGIERRPDMVALCSGVIEQLGLRGLRIEQGDLQSWQPQPMNVMIALHACDTATDHAIDLGLRGGADIILCSPCCHQELRPQLLSPHPLRAILQHGVHRGQQAEMLTDGLRAMLLEAAGYDTQVFEFVALEHTQKNKMILAVRRPVARADDAMLAQIAEVKAFYGIREQRLETLIAQRRRAV